MRRPNWCEVSRVCLPLFVCALFTASFVQAQVNGAGISISPVSVGFGNELAGTTSAAVTVTVTNTGSVPVTVTPSTAAPFTVRFTGSPTLSPGQQLPLSVTFAPTSAATVNGALSVASTAGPFPVIASLSGTGVTTPPAVTVTPMSLSFGNQTVGTSSPQTGVTFTITGSLQKLLIGVGVTGPFSGPGFDGSAGFKPGQQFRTPLAFNPTLPANASGTVGFFFSDGTTIIPALSGTGTAVASLTVTTVSPIPAATQNASYSAVLAASGGTPPYNWALASGSSMPAGLALSSTGGVTTISGSPSSAPGAYYSFVADVTDSGSPPLTAATMLSLWVGAPTGGVCNQFSYGSPPFIPLVDMGTGTFDGQEGGLYGAMGSNADPPDHQAAGVSIAEAIQPLDSSGNPNPNGKYVLVSIGMSNAEYEFKHFIYSARSNPSLNPHLVIVDGAQSGFGIAALSGSNTTYWNNLINTILPEAGVSLNQVVAAWVEETQAGTASSTTFNAFVTSLQGQYESIARNLHTYFPNLKLAYWGTRSYGGYGSTTQSPEPFAYYTGFGIRGAILDQVGGDCGVNFDPTQCDGVVTAPWMAWASYAWANGLTPRSDGLVWTCQDFQSDGTHPSLSGRQKVGTQLLNFFASDPTTTPWFLAP